MRVVTTLLAAIALLVSAANAAAQSGQRPGATGPAATGGTANTNTLTTGTNRNTNANSNSQFLSGSNTGVNNGSLEVYAGADPYQGIVLEGSTNLPQLPGIPSPPSNFSQPYRPDAFVNTPPFLPVQMTLEDAKRCRDAKASWYGGSRDGDAPSIKLFYAGKPESPAIALTMANYVGTAMATTSDGPFLAALCEAAYRAMRKGATVGMVEFNVRPKNTMFGLGFGASGGASGLPAAGAHPYAIASTLGFGTGWSNQRVEGEVVLQLTALSESSIASAGSSASASSVSALMPGRVDDAAPSSGASSSEHSPSAAPKILLTSASQSIEVRTRQSAGAGRELALDGRRDTASELRREDESTVKDVTKPATSVTAVRSASPATTDVEHQQTVAYHPPKRLGSVRKGQAKEVVFGLFGTVFDKRDGKIIEIQGMRLMASGQSASSMRFEVSEVRLGEDHGPKASYWFLFEAGRLLTWGRPEEWGATASRYRLDLPYSPELQPSRVEAKADVPSGR